jgi:hypothetical protein
MTGFVGFKQVRAGSLDFAKDGGAREPAHFPAVHVLWLEFPATLITVIVESNLFLVNFQKDPGDVVRGDITQVSLGGDHDALWIT